MMVSAFLVNVKTPTHFFIDAVYAAVLEIAF